MDELTISLLAPVGRQPRIIDSWVEEQVDRLRVRSRSSGVLLGRLVRARPAYGGDWLIKVDRRDRGGAPENDIALATIVAELEWRGLRPAVFVISSKPGARRSRNPHSSGAAPARLRLPRRTRPTSRRRA